MKKLIQILTLTLSGFLNAQKTDTVYVGTNKFITIHFPAEVEYHQISTSVANSLGIKSIDENLFIENLDKKLPETNLLVKTTDGKYYSFLILYSTHIKDLDIYIKKSPAWKEPESTQPANTTTVALEEKVLKMPGYIKSRNLAQSKGIKAILKGIYFQGTKLYFLFTVKNTTEVTYDISSFRFSVINSNEKTGEQTEEFPILITTPNIKSIEHGKKDIVFTLNKFTVSNDKRLIFEIFENKGDRNISFPILPKMIDNAQLIKN
jgi:hypothetical protein